MKRRFTAEPADEGTRLDVFLAKAAGVSRAAAQKAIEAGSVLFKGENATAHDRLKAGDVIELVESLAPEKAVKMKPDPKVSFAIVYEDKDIAVIDKPSGLLVHPAVATDTKTLVHGLIAHWPEMAKVGESLDRPGIMHRLDREASGLMVVAKNQKAYDHLKDQFQRHDIHKEYLVLVSGQPSKDDETVRLAIGRSSSGGKMAAKPKGGRDKKRKDEKPAVTHYSVETRYRDAAYLRVKTETGRTHQIRVHMKALGHPVAGDTLYIVRGVKPVNSPRLFLHATKLGFTHPKTTKQVEFESPLPKELQTFIDKLP